MLGRDSGTGLSLEKTAPGRAGLVVVHAGSAGRGAFSRGENSVNQSARKDVLRMRLTFVVGAMGR